MCQTCNFPVCLSFALDQWDSSLNEDLNEDISCEEWKDEAIEATREPICLLYPILQAQAQSWKLLLTGVYPLKSRSNYGRNEMLMYNIHLITTKIWLILAVYCIVKSDFIITILSSVYTNIYLKINIILKNSWLFYFEAPIPPSSTT